jgi:hypothetical protein
VANPARGKATGNDSAPLDMGWIDCKRYLVGLLCGTAEERK